MVDYINFLIIRLYQYYLIYFDSKKTGNSIQFNVISVFIKLACVCVCVRTRMDWYIHPPSQPPTNLPSFTTLFYFCFCLRILCQCPLIINDHWLLNNFQLSTKLIERNCLKFPLLFLPLLFVLVLLSFGCFRWENLFVKNKLRDLADEENKKKADKISFLLLVFVCVLNIITPTIIFINWLKQKSAVGKYFQASNF